MSEVEIWRKQAAEKIEATLEEVGPPPGHTEIQGMKVTWGDQAESLILQRRHIQLYEEDIAAAQRHREFYERELPRSVEAQERVALALEGILRYLEREK